MTGVDLIENCDDNCVETDEGKAETPEDRAEDSTTELRVEVTVDESERISTDETTEDESVCEDLTEIPDDVCELLRSGVELTSDTCEDCAEDIAIAEETVEL